MLSKNESLKRAIICQLTLDGMLAWQLQIEEYRKGYHAFIPSLLSTADSASGSKASPQIYQFFSEQGIQSFTLRATDMDGDCFFHAVNKQGFTRAALIQKLRDNGHDEKIRELFALEIRQFLYLGYTGEHPNREENNACQEMLNKEFKDLLEALETAEKTLKEKIQLARKELGEEKSKGKEPAELLPLLIQRKSDLAAPFEESQQAVLNVDAKIRDYCSRKEVFQNYITLYIEQARGYISFSRDFMGAKSKTTIDVFNQLFNLNIQIYLLNPVNSSQLLRANQPGQGEEVSVFHNGINHFWGLSRQLSAEIKEEAESDYQPSEQELSISSSSSSAPASGTTPSSSIPTLDAQLGSNKKPTRSGQFKDFVNSLMDAGSFVFQPFLDFLERNKYIGMQNIDIMLAASKIGDIETVRKQIALGTSIEVQDSQMHQYRPLHHAAQHGHDDLAQLLLEQDALVDAPNNNRNLYTPLHLAAYGGHSKVVQIFITTWGAFVDPLDWRNATPLRLAAERKDELTVKLLLENGANLKNVGHGYGSASEALAFIEIVTNKYQLKPLKSVDPLKRISPENLVAEHPVKCRRIKLTPQRMDVMQGSLYAKALEIGLSDNKVVTHITLNDCNIGDGGIEYLGQLLERNNIITHLNLERNNIGNDGLILFCRSLSKNTSLVFLNLHWNAIFDDGALALAEVLEKHPSLIRVDLTDNLLTEKGNLAIKQAIGKKKETRGSVNLSNGTWNRVTIRVWTPQNLSEFGHVSLETYSKENAIYASFWPQSKKEIEALKDSPQLKETITNLRLLTSQIEVADNFLEMSLDKDIEQEGGIKPEYTLHMYSLDVPAINKAFQAFKEEANKQDGLLRWKLTGDSNANKFQHSCSSFCLYLLRAGRNYKIIDPLCQEIGIRGFTTVSPGDICRLAKAIIQIEMQSTAGDSYSLSGLYPYSVPRSNTLVAFNAFRDRDESPVQLGRDDTFAGSQPHIFVAKPSDKDPPSRFGCIVQ